MLVDCLQEDLCLIFLVSVSIEDELDAFFLELVDSPGLESFVAGEGEHFLLVSFTQLNHIWD